MLYTAIDLLINKNLNYKSVFDMFEMECTYENLYIIYLETKPWYDNIYKLKNTIKIIYSQNNIIINYINIESKIWNPDLFKFETNEIRKDLLLDTFRTQRYDLEQTSINMEFEKLLIKLLMFYDNSEYERLKLLSI